MRIYLITSLLALTLCSACTKSVTNSKTFWIDNPTENEITVKIDDQMYTIPSMSGLNVPIAFGKHTLSYNSQSVNFVAKKCNQDVIMNPTLSNYVFYHNMYFDLNHKSKAMNEAEKIQAAYLYDFEVEPGEIIKVPFKVTNQLFLERYAYYWHYDPSTTYPQSATVVKGSTSLSTVVKSKMFREKEFIKYIGNEVFDEGFAFKASSTTNLNELKPLQFIPIEETYICDKSKQLAEKVIQRFDSLAIVSVQEFPHIYHRLERMPYVDQAFDRDNEEECAALTAEKPDFTTTMLKASRAIESIGEMSGFIVK